MPPRRGAAFEGGYFLGHLERQFPGRHQDQGRDRRLAHWFFWPDRFDQGYAEGGGLARAGAGAGGEGRSLSEKTRDGERLNGRWFLEPFFCQGFQHCGR